MKKSDPKPLHRYPILEANNLDLFFPRDSFSEHSSTKLNQYTGPE